MDKSFGLHFHLKKSKNSKEMSLLLYMRITADGAYCEISTKRRCDSKQWNNETGRMTGKTESSKLFNAYLDTLQQKVFEAKRKLIEIDREITPEAIKNLMLGIEINTQKHMLMEIFQQHNDQMSALVGQEFPGYFLQDI